MPLLRGFAQEIVVLGTVLASISLANHVFILLLLPIQKHIAFF